MLMPHAGRVRPAYNLARRDRRIQEDLGVMMTEPSSTMAFRADLSVGLLSLVLGCFASPGVGRAHDSLPSTAAAEAVAPISGTLYICGGGRVPEEVLKGFLTLAGGEKAHIAVITTASETADSADVESRIGFWRKDPIAELTILHTRSREVAEDPRFSQSLARATGVWFIGGHQQR